MSAAGTVVAAMVYDVHMATTTITAAARRTRRVAVNGDIPRTARTEAQEYFAFARRILRAASRRVGNRDIEGLAGLVALRDEIDEAIDAAVATLRSEEGGGYSYTDIGRVLGISRQAAQQRFRHLG